MKKTNVLKRVLCLTLALIACLSIFPTTASAATNYTSYASPCGIVSGSYANTRFYRSNRSTYPFVLDSPLYSCYGFTLNYKITEVTKGDMTSRFKYGIYVHTTSGIWKLVKECYFDTDLDTTIKITWNLPVSIDQVAVVCYKNEPYCYTSAMTISNPICR